MGRSRRCEQHTKGRQPGAGRLGGPPAWEGGEGHGAALAAWASWSAGGYHRYVVGPFHPQVRGGAGRVIAGELRALARSGGGCVLDAGCGPGNLLGWMDASGISGLRVVGLDADEGALGAAAAVAGRCGTEFRAVAADLCETGAVRAALAGERVDVVVAVNSLLPAAVVGAAPRRRFLEEASVLAEVAPAGRLVAVLPGWSKHAALELGEGAPSRQVGAARVEAAVAWRLGTNGDGVAHVLHTEATLRDELPRAGWEVLECRRVVYPVELAGAMSTDWVVVARSLWEKAPVEGGER